MHHPDEDFAVSGSDYCAGESSSKNSSVLWRALFDLDTLYYPTATAHIEVAHFDHFFYATTAKAQFNVINICVQDQFTFKVWPLIFYNSSKAQNKTKIYLVKFYK